MYANLSKSYGNNRHFQEANLSCCFSEAMITSLHHNICYYFNGMSTIWQKCIWEKNVSKLKIQILTRFESRELKKHEIKLC